MADPALFTVAEFRTLPDMDDADTYTEAKILKAAAHFTEIIEDNLWPMSAQTFVDKFDGPGSASLPLSQPRNATLTSVTVDGVTVTTSLLTISAAGSLRYKSGTAWWATDAGGIVVTYTAGESACPADLKDSLMWATRDRLLSQSDLSGVDVRKTSINTDFGTTNYVLPGENRPTGYPELDAIILRRQKSSPSVA